MPSSPRHLRLLQDQFDGVLLLVRWVLILLDDALDHDPQAGADVLPAGQIDGQVLLQVLGQFVRDLLQGFVTEFLDRRLIVGKGIVADLVLGQPRLSPRCEASRNFLAISINSSMTCAVSMARFW